MTTMTCGSCGQRGAQITGARGFCTACGNLPSRKPDPVRKLMVPCLRCGTAREHGAACAVCAGTAVGAGKASGAHKGMMPLPMSFFVATVATLLHWTLLSIFSHVVDMASGVPAAFFHTPVAGPAPFGAFNVGVNLGGVAATAIFWIMAGQRRPFIGAAAGVCGGTMVTLFSWLLAFAM